MKITVQPKEDPLKFENVDAREALVEDMINAQRVSGESEGPAFTTALLAEICMFDEKKLKFEDLKKVRSCDFLSLQLDLTMQGALGSKDLLSSLQEKLKSVSTQ